MQALYDLPAPAKLNLFLHITGRRADGYHLLQSAFMLIDWCDSPKPKGLQRASSGIWVLEIDWTLRFGPWSFHTKEFAMNLFCSLTAAAFFSATLIGCGGEAPQPKPAPKIDLGSSSDAAEAPAGNAEPDAKKVDEPEQPKSEDKPKEDGEAKANPPKTGDAEVALAPKAGAAGAFDPTAETLKVIKTMKVIFHKQMIIQHC